MGRMTHFPQPSGSYKIGKVHLHFIDDHRVDPFPGAEGKNRDVPIMIWYPADEIGSQPPELYMKPADITNFVKFDKIYKLGFGKVFRIQTNSYKGIPISAKEAQFPVIIFNHGFTSFLEQNTAQMEYLASYGYIVVSIGHPYDGVASYPDGRSIPMDNSKRESLTKEDRKKQKEDIKQMMKISKKLQTKDLPFNELEHLTKTFLTIPSSYGDMNEKIEVWVADVLFIIDVLEKLNTGVIESIFQGKFDLENGIGAFGHSYGGATSILAPCIDDRLSCGINLDGSMYGGFNEKYTYQKPFLFIEGGETGVMSRYFFEINQNDSYLAAVKNATHMDFSDMSLFGKNWLSKLIKLSGKIDGDRLQRIVNSFVKAFFDRYIKKIDAPLLDSDSFDGVLIEKKSARTRKL